MQLVVNGSLRETGELAPDTTLLHYLRRHCGLTGTKEGCASGDCGACTVMIEEGNAADRRYRSVNSCICPLGSLENQKVVTVEGLSGEAATHPVQAAMVACHGSQCGFCTPGFVMSLAALHGQRNPLLAVDDKARRAAVLDAISGNLCRCTGYRPIVEAGLQALEKPAHLDNFVQEEGASAPLTGIRADVPIPGYWQPRQEEQLQALLREHPEARLIAGGTDLMLEVTQRYVTLPKLIDLNAVESLRRIHWNAEDVEVGAAVTYTELERELGAQSPPLLALLHRLGSRQIRNRGTLGGNIGNASPIADTPPWLLSLDASLCIRNGSGESRYEKLTDFYRGYKHTSLQPGEYIAQIVIRRTALADPLRLYKLSKRYEDDISAVMGAFRWDANGALWIAYGGMAATPKRATKTEAFLNQSIWHREGGVDEGVLDQACECLDTEFSPMTDVRASARYRLAMAKNMLRKACRSLAAERSGRVCEPGVFEHA
ncbi:xanthine dehydrogenase small subunit [Marinimicrobium sp. ARAG 43.8]|uniref:xanthine dehydrogenase small subunit n=1 Tax=Marinimicrobium sp. ARAG 43.8 TaxID=3418719 RepID=UPI003CF14D24